MRETKVVKLKDVISTKIQNGYSPLCQEDSSGSWVLSLGALTGYSFDSSQVKAVSSTVKMPEEYRLKNNDILVSRSNTLDKVGRCGVFNGEIENCFYPDLMMRFCADENIVLTKYLEIVLQSEFGRKYFQERAAGTSVSMMKINKKILEDFSFSLPSLTEQEKIINFAQIWDSAIEKTEKLITLEEKKLDAFAVKLFLGKTKFPTKNRYLSEILEEQSDSSTGLEEVYSVSVHKGLVNQIEHLGRSFAAANTDNYNLVKFGHLVYTKSPTGDFPYGIVKQSSIKKDVIVSPLYGIYEPITYEIGLIVEFFFESPIRCKNYLYPLIQKGAKNTISISNQDFLKGKINFPENEEDIIKIAEFIRISKEYIALLNAQLEQYKLQKQGLMQKLLTDEWRVK